MLSMNDESVSAIQIKNANMAVGIVWIQSD
jgi:hypothetical protein